MLVRRPHFENPWPTRTLMKTLNLAFGGTCGGWEMKVFGIKPVFLHSLALTAVTFWSFLHTCLLFSVPPCRSESLDCGPQTLACTHTHLCPYSVVLMKRILCEKGHSPEQDSQVWISCLYLPKGSFSDSASFTLFIIFCAVKNHWFYQLF